MTPPTPPEDPRSSPTEFFTVHLWREALGDGRAEWRGKVLHVSSGMARYFRDWPTLIRFLEQGGEHRDSG